MEVMKMENNIKKIETDKEFLDTKINLAVVMKGTFNECENIKRLLAETNIQIVYRKLSIERLYICGAKEYEEQQEGLNDKC
jgi:hypothetical protein